MHKEYLFYDQNPLEFPLDESIEVLNSLENVTAKYIVSNIQNEKSYIYAPEINFYINNSQDDISQKIHNVKKLYDAKAECFESMMQEEFCQKVTNKVIVIAADEKEQFLADLQEAGFISIVLAPTQIVEIKGHIGDFKVSFEKDGEVLELITDQIISFFEEKKFTFKAGFFDASKQEEEKILELVSANLGEYHYKSFLSYDENICQYHHRRGEICTECVKVCPSEAITKNSATKELVFSHIDCIGCGKCVSVCPSGALDVLNQPLDAFSAMSGFYKNSTVLLIPKKVDLETLHVKLPKGVLPLVIESKDALSEAHFLTLLQTSGNPVLFFTKTLKDGALEVVTLVNEIFNRKYNKQAIFTCKDENELLDACEKAQSLNECSYGINQEGMNKREIFSARLAHLVGEENLGVIHTSGAVHYGNLTIDEQKCTLCFSCIGACNMKALTAHPEDNSLRFNPSLCTSCGYCVASCAESGCISVVANELTLAPEYFVQNIMAKDELFKCSQCGVEFATVKSVQKIASVMAPLFANDPRKMATLYCCAQCKPKVMFGDALERGFVK